MASETNGRPLMPQNGQMQTISFAPPTLARQESGQRSFVFVDEHNRHRRLKVMRACEGCRRRKIRCDAATTNIWPCSSCTRLKLNCIPPTAEGEPDTSNPNRHQFLDNPFMSTIETEDDFDSGSQRNGSRGESLSSDSFTTNDFLQPQIQAGNVSDPTFAQFSFSDKNFFDNPAFNGQLAASDAFPLSSADLSSFQSAPMFPTPPPQPASETADSYQSDHSGTDLSEQLGGLRIDESGVPRYIADQKRALAEAPVQGEDEDLQQIPYFPVQADLTIRIPPEYMPSDQQALYYFSIFFNDIHPYVPVLDKHRFYEQWYHDRDSISPLILEAIFACAGRLSRDPSQGTKWLVIAGRHADSFMDVPRLSTIQALLIILKARESAPKRGYYFRSWMTIKNIVTLAMELGLHEHYDLHKQGQFCPSSPPDCLVKTRVWQTAFVCELMIGAPQGRLDLSVNPESVDTSIPKPTAGLDESAIQLTRNFGFVCGIVRVVRNMNDVWGKVKNKKDWGVDPAFISINPEFEHWFNNLPSDLQVSYPTSSEAPPHLPSHFVGNLHSYYHLSVVMLHRPQLAFTDTSVANGEWQKHMLICHDSAKKLCRLQEAILERFGLQGLLCMQRGINFTIYCVLTCTVLHLVAITSPLPSFNQDAKEYFTRHMRILERCTSSWPMPEMQTQIDALREAFSEDVTKPFKLRSTFPYGSPGAPPLQHSFPTTSLVDAVTYQPEPSMATLMPGNSNLDDFSIANPLTPNSNGSYEVQEDSPGRVMLMQQQQQQQHEPPLHQSSIMHHQRQQSHDSQQISVADPIYWNPSKIFDNWNTAFGTQPSTPSPAVPTPLRIPAAVYHSPPLPQTLQHPTSNPIIPQPQHPRHNSSSSNASDQNTSYLTVKNNPLNPPQHSHTSTSQSLGPTFVSPGMWQESVASVYGSKRRWEELGGAGILDGVGVKRPR